MDIKKIEKRIKKISNLVDLIKLDGKLSQIERDLLLDYVRKLYDDLLSSKEVEVSPTPVVKVETPLSKVEEPVIEISDKQSAPSIEPIIQEVEVAPIEEMQPLDNTKTATEAISEGAQIADHNLSEDLFDELFVFDEIKDLSNKLGMAKINDINKAIGINERIFTIKELFGGDNEVYSTTVSELNNTNSFNEAKEILIKKVASKYSWDDETKFKKAQHFIKIVRRLYA